jgi:hypothetical protein
VSYLSSTYLSSIAETYFGNEKLRVPQNVAISGAYHVLCLTEGGTGCVSNTNRTGVAKIRGGKMKYGFLILTVFTALTFAACGKSGGDSVATVPAPAPGAAPIGQTVPVSQCQIGQVSTTSYGCLYRNSCTYGFGWLPGQGQCVPGTPITEQTVYGTAFSTRFFGTMSVVNTNQFALLMKYANLCDPYWVGYNFGTWNCSTWTSRGGFVELRTFAGISNATTNVNMFVGAGTAYSSSMSNWSYSYQLSQSSQYIGFSQQATVVDYNNSTGMQIIGVTSGQDVGVRLIIATGHLTDQQFTADVMYQNVKIATINFQRY